MIIRTLAMTILTILLLKKDHKQFRSLSIIMPQQSLEYFDILMTQDSNSQRYRFFLCSAKLHVTITEANCRTNRLLDKGICPCSRAKIRYWKPQKLAEFRDRCKIHRAVNFASQVKPKLIAFLSASNRKRTFL